MKHLPTEQVLKRIVSIANDKDDGPPFDGNPVNIYFWERVEQLQEEGYLTNIYVTKDNKGQPIGIIIPAPVVLTTKGEEYLASHRQNKWWCKTGGWIISAIGAVIIYILGKLCDSLF